MADRQLFTNNAVTLLAAPITATATTLTVMAGNGQMFPSPAAGEYFLVTLEDQASTVREIIRVNGRTGDTFTGLVRGQEQDLEGMPPRAWSASAGSDTLVDHRITARTMFNALEQGTDEVGVIDILDEGTSLGSATSLDFVGGGVTVSGAGPAKTVTIPAPPAPTLSIDDLTDVDTVTAPPSIGQTLKWDGTNWVPGNDNIGGPGGTAPVFNAAYTLIPADPDTVLQTTQSFIAGSTSLYVGGLRQKLGSSYTESAPNQLTLPYVLTQAMIDEGQDITIDFIAS